MRPGYQLIFFVVAIVLWLAAAGVPRFGPLRLNLIALGLVVVVLPTTIALFKDAVGVGPEGLLPGL
jgi:hypothetical protein